MRGQKFLVGHFVGQIINFTIVVFVIFMIMRAFLKAPPTKECLLRTEAIPVAAKRCARGMIMRVPLVLVLVLVLVASPAVAEEAKVERQVGEHRVVLDISGQVLGVELPKDFGFGSGEVEAPIAATLAGLHGAKGFVSASVLAQKAKQFDDGLYAAVELLAQRGAGTFRGKAGFLETLARGTEVAEVVAAARLGGARIAASPEAEEIERAFLANELCSKPIGFYTWSPELRAIFQQDRMLQSELKDVPKIAALAAAMRRDPKLAATYDSYLRLVARLTNPFLPEYRDLRAVKEGQPPPERGVNVFPPSRSHETVLMKRLYGDRSIPEGFSLTDELVKQIRARSISLEPRPESGWYDHVAWSLEPLAAPDKAVEAKKLELGPRYRKQLEDLFKTVLALARETHAKQLEWPEVGSAMQMPRPSLDVYPELSAEPLATHYLRRGLAYRFVRGVVADAFGADALKGARRLTAEGAVEAPLADELDRMERLFLGAAAAVREELGLAPEGDPKPFRDWAAVLEKDPDVAVDARMMVPLFHDVERKKTKVLAFLGWATRPVLIHFAKTPAVVVVIDKAGKRLAEGEVEVHYRANMQTLAYPVVAEVYVKKILDRNEFRSHCDKWKTRREILANLD